MKNNEKTKECSQGEATGCQRTLFRCLGWIAHAQMRCAILAGADEIKQNNEKTMQKQWKNNGKPCKTYKKSYF